MEGKNAARLSDVWTRRDGDRPPIPHKHVNGRGRYMAAVCYTCYRPARTGYVRQSIALILALGAATHRVCVSVVVCTAVPVVYRIPSPSVSTIPTFSLSSRSHPSLHLVSQELHHQVITSTSRTPSVVLPASHPDAFTGPRSFPKPSAACHSRIIAKPSFPKESRDWCFQASHFDEVVRYFSFWLVVTRVVCPTPPCNIRWVSILLEKP